MPIAHGDCLTIYISNMSEDVWQFIDMMGSEQERRAEIDDNVNNCDRDLFALAAMDEFVFISPAPLDAGFLEYYQSVCGRKKITCLTPARHSGLICSDILADREVLRTLLALARAHAAVEIRSYCFSSQLLHLAEELRGAGVTVHLPEAPAPGSEWTVDFFGSKGGIRQLFQQPEAHAEGHRFPAGFVVQDPRTAARLAAELYLERGGVVVKTNKGHAGAGLLIVRKGQIGADLDQAAAALQSRLESAPYWRHFPIIVEELIEIDSHIGGGSPSVEYRISDGGTVEYLYSCGMRVTREGVFQGVEIHSEAVPHEVNQMMISAGRYAAEAYAKFGYRGYFDIDFHAAQDGMLYVGESNVRRTGGTHVFHLGQHLLGCRLNECCVLAANSRPLPGNALTFAEARAVLTPIAYDAAQQTGLVLCSALKFRQAQIAFVIIGRDREHAIEIEQRMERLLAAA